MSPLRLFVALSISTCGICLGQKKPLDHTVYDGWNSIRGTSLSRDGKWLLYVVTPQEGDATATIRNVADGHSISVPRGTVLKFTKDSKFVVGLISPKFEDTRKAKRAKAKPDDMPGNALVIVNLESGKVTEIEKVDSFDLADDDAGWLVYKPHPSTTPTNASPAPPSAASPKAAGQSSPEPPKAEKKLGQQIVLRRLDTADEEKIPDVAAEAFSKDGYTLAYSTSTKGGKGDGVTLCELKTKKRVPVFGQEGEYPRLALTANGSWLAFEFGKRDEKTKTTAFSAYLFNAKTHKSQEIGTDSLPKGWSVNEKSPLHFSEAGTRLLYATHLSPPPDPKEVPDDEKVNLDVWNWQDSRLQTQQLLEANHDRDIGYTALFDLRTSKSMQLETKDLTSVQVSNKGDGRYALGTSDTAYLRQGSWTPGLQDIYLIDLKTGARRQIAHGFRGEVQLSPSGAFVAIYDASAKQWAAMDSMSGKRVPIGADIPYPIVNELNDVPDVPEPYGIAGWTYADAAVLIEDRYDLWSVDPTGKHPAKRLTAGRDLKTRYRPINLDPEEAHGPYLDLDRLLLSAFNERTKQGGVSRFNHGHVEGILLADKTYGGFVKAKDADTLVFTRQDFIEFPDVWLSDVGFKDPRKVTEANPQQKNYLWGKAELVQWTSLDGVALQGILIKPENFDYAKKYPLITYFYERNSDLLNVYHAPAPSASTINWTLFASNGYCIFIPDIPYRIGYPGYSALSAIVPGVQSIVSRGYIDPNRLGIQGQSWGGYQVAYLVTQTNMFAAAEAGAPVGDMFSAYGGIRYGSGVVREFQYEHGQSRIDGTPWNSTLRFIENSPVFFADKIQTPLMIMSNDQDGAVPHTQGIELFTALRRLDKPCWMVVYNGEDHNIVQRKNRKDFSIRLSQYFDHFLKGAPMPVWMSKGIPAVDKGRTMGLDLDQGIP